MVRLRRFGPARWKQSVPHPRAASSDRPKTVGKDEKRIFDVLSQGLATEFPNPDRVGCPGSAVLEGIASHKIPLSEAEKWLDHLGSCSPCFQDFKAIKRKLHDRRGFSFGGGLANLFGGLGV